MYPKNTTSEKTPKLNSDYLNLYPDSLFVKDILIGGPTSTYHHNETDPTISDHFDNGMSVVGLDMIGALMLSICVCVLSLWRYGKQMETERIRKKVRRGSFGMYPDVVKQVEARSWGFEKTTRHEVKDTSAVRMVDNEAFNSNSEHFKSISIPNEPIELLFEGSVKTLQSTQFSNAQFVFPPQKVTFEEIPTSPDITSLINTPLLTPDNYESILDFGFISNLDSYSTLPESFLDKAIQCGSMQVSTVEADLKSETHRQFDPNLQSEVCLDSCECCSIVTVPEAFKDSLITLESPSRRDKRRKRPQIFKSASVANCLVSGKTKISIPKLVHANKYQSFG